MCEKMSNSKIKSGDTVCIFSKYSNIINRINVFNDAYEMSKKIKESNKDKVIDYEPLLKYAIKLLDVVGEMFKENEIELYVNTK